ncbi:DNA polymerase III polC-type [Mesomycoplasma conjunctivae]|uniref:DNA polymerase III PolC-type n=1 Tax=Mesomycoplasma conjunctivae (strain ATCC 25834 / NCTC 10147 / HRC/581) TaxID=572263 RepID=C5J7D7_MESCH|nr:PolC-type DNA polymerase III [Mesomycoplasma conjunctivae]CAT05400.1 DNA polymerase III alpha subunit [Mesomycoplasma conjunctivae]VEU66625.1 DNA polymerase III polC-type [Mesomycoplasma conjunctivae]
MDKKFKKLCDFIGWSVPYDWDDVTIEKDPNPSELMNIRIFKTSLPKAKSTYDLLQNVQKFNTGFPEKYSFKLNLDLKIEQPDFKDEEFLDYANLIAQLVFKQANFFTNLEFIRNNIDEFTVLFLNKETFQLVLKNEDKFFKIAKKLGIPQLKINFLYDDRLENQISIDELNARQKSLIRPLDSPKITKKKASSKPLKEYEFIDLKDIRSHLQPSVWFYAQVYKINSIKTKKNTFFNQIFVNDANYTEAVKFSFASKNENLDFVVGDYLKVWADILKPENPFKDNVDISLRKLEKVKRPESFGLPRIDNAKKKRVELTARTSKSTMDGISSPKEYVEAAEQMGFTAIGIADSDSVQAFPDFFNALKGKSIKGIYGSTFSTVSSKIHKVLNYKKNFDLKSARYVVFDLETTGLSPVYNEIIEFGAVVIQDGIQTESHQFFVKAKEPIPTEITKITNITQEMVDEQGIEATEAFYRISKIIKDSILVAHNAKFDFNFLAELFKKEASMTIDQPIIDTLQVSRFLNPSQKSHSLKNVSKLIGLYYDETVAHRADYDAEILSKVWLNFLTQILDQDITDLKKLEYTSQSIFDLKPEKVFSKEFTIIAKNQAGIKKLYQLVSLSNTDYLISKPLLFYDLLEKDENLLIGSGGPESILIDNLLFSTKENAEKFIPIFDFIELPPPEAFRHLIERNMFKKEHIFDLLKTLIAFGKKYKKPVVAIGDVRYVEPKQKIFHELYIYAKRVGGGSHNLFDHREREDYKKSHIFPDKYLFTTEELINQFAFLEDEKLIKEIVIKNSNLISDQIDNNIEIIKPGLYKPKFDNSEYKLKEFVYENAHKKYGKIIPEKIEKRIKRELNPIIEHGFHVIYWISKSLVHEAKRQGAIVDSRGSVGSSIVAYLTGITDVNPLEPHYLCLSCQNVEFSDDPDILCGYDLPEKKCSKCGHILNRDGQNIPFETFLGFEADKVPDIDLNFSSDIQLKMHDYVRDLFGDKNTFRAGTILTNAEKTVYGLARKLSEVKASLDKRFQSNQEISFFTTTFMDFLATKANGVKRTSGKHAGGIIVIPEEYDIEDFTPINYPANNEKSGWKTTHFDYDSIHDNLLKLDILGHDDPKILLLLEEITGIKSETIPKSDPQIIELFYSTKPLKIKPEQIGGELTGAIGLPEFGTPFVRKMLQNARVKSFADIVAICGLSHGKNVWQDNAEPLIREQKLQIKDVISCRDDIMIYLIKQNLDPLTAFNIMERVRKGKGVDEEQEQLMIAKNVPNWYIDSLKKIGYMFPKAHAAAYAMKAWKIAFFKLYYPLAFYSVFFTIRPDVKDIDSLTLPHAEIDRKIKELRKKVNSSSTSVSAKEKDLIPFLEISLELKARGFEIEKINLEKSEAQQWIINYENNSLIPPFSSLEGIGDINASNIVKARSEKAFISIEDFEQRTGTNSTAIKKLEEMGVFKNISKKAQVSLFDF